MGLLFHIGDFFNTSEVEAKYNEYDSLVRTLTTILNQLDEYQTQYSESSAALLANLSPDDGAASGTLQDTYAKAYSCFSEDIANMESAFSAAISDLKDKLADAEEQKEYYKGLVDLENQQESEISLD